MREKIRELTIFILGNGGKQQKWLQLPLMRSFLKVLPSWMDNWTLAKTYWKLCRLFCNLLENRVPQVLHKYYIGNSKNQNPNPLEQV